MVRMILGLLEGNELEALTEAEQSTYSLSAAFPRAIHEERGLGPGTTPPLVLRLRFPQPFHFAPNLGRAFPS